MAGLLQSPGARGFSQRAVFDLAIRLRDEFNELFERFQREGNGWQSEFGALPADLNATDSDWQVRVDLPGVDPSEIDVRASGDRNTLERLVYVARRCCRNQGD